MDPAEPIKGDAYSMKLPQLPLNWTTAIDAFNHGVDVQKIFSEQLQTMFVQCKQQELKRFSQQVTDFEYQSYLEIV